MNCYADAGTGSACPPGCALEGPILGPSCMPIAPEIDYQANTASDCLSETVTPQDLDADVDVSRPGENVRSVVHGTLSAKLLGGSGDAASPRVHCRSNSEPAILSRNSYRDDFRLPTGSAP